MKKLVIIFGMVVALVGFTTFSAQADVVPIGSSLTIFGTNAPDDYSSAATFGTTTLIDGGAVSLTTSQISDGAGGEWDIFSFTTVSGGPIGGNPALGWQIAMNFDLSQAANFVGVVDQWTNNGTPVTGISDFGGITGAGTGFLGTGYYTSGFSVPYAAGAFTSTEWIQIGVSPYSFATTGGGNPADANGFTFALDFQAQNQTPVGDTVPEPATFLLLGAGLAGLGLLRGRGKKAGS